MLEGSEIVPQRIKQVRKLKRRKIHDCATLLGISKATYAQFEEGTASLTLPEIELLAAFFCVPTRQFFDREPLDDKRSSILSESTKPQFKKLRQKMIRAQLSLARQKRGLSLDEIRDRTSISMKDLKAYEKGKIAIPYDHLLQISKALSLPFDTFYTEVWENETVLINGQNQTDWHSEYPKQITIEKSYEAHRDAHLMHAIEKLPKEDQAQVAKVLLKKLRAL